MGEAILEHHKEVSTQTTVEGLNERLAFMQIDEAARHRLTVLKPLIEREIGPALDRFYNAVRRDRKVARLFQDEQHIDGAKSRQTGHWATISSGTFDQSYAAKVERVGKVHARIGLEPRWYIGGYALILENLVKAVVAERWPLELAFWRGKRHADEAGAGISSLVKAALLDMDLAISVYLAAAEEERKKVAEQAAEISRQRDIATALLAEGLRKLATKDLTHRITEAMPEDYKALQNDFNAAMDQLEGVIRSVVDSTQSINTGTQEISTASDDMARRTESQAANLEQTAAAVAEITNKVKQAAAAAVEARTVVGAAKEEAAKSGEVVKRAIDSMTGIQSSSQQITRIIGVIDEIAFQTNLLALNAGVEAARAGEAGRGFAVVAQEVRALAQRSAAAAKEIKELIASSQSQVQQGVQLVAETGVSLDRIIERVMQINEAVQHIAVASEEQATGLVEVNTAVDMMDQTTQQNAAMVEEATAATKSLAQQSDDLNGIISTFLIKSQQVLAKAKGTVAAPRAAVQVKTAPRPHKAAPLAPSRAPAKRSAATPPPKTGPNSDRYSWHRLDCG